MYRALHSPLIRLLLALVLIASAATPVFATAHQDKGEPVKRGQPQPPEPPDPPDPPSHPVRVNLKGQIQDLPDDTSLVGIWTVLDRVGATWEIEVTAETKITPTHAEPAEGDWVHVMARGEMSQSTLIAEHINVEQGGEQRARPAEIKGEIELLPDTLDFTGGWVVDGVSFVVDERTMIHPDRRTPEIGMLANVSAFQQPDGSLWAKNIALHPEEKPEVEEIEFEGPIEVLPDEGLLGEWVVRGISVTVTSDTRLKGAPPAIGLWAEVEGILQEDSSVLASEINVEGPELREIEFEGTIVLTDTIPGEWVIAVTTPPTDTTEVTVTVTSDTIIDERKGPAEVGATIQVKAVEQSDGTLLALRIKVKPGPAEDHEIEFEGIIESLPEGGLLGEWVVQGISVTVTADTELEGAIIAIGLWAEVEGFLQSDGSVLATKIEVEEPEVEEVEFEGPIEALPESGLLGDWVVRGISVTVTSDTRLKGAPPTLGFWAEVEGVQQGDGSVLANEIEVKGPGGDDAPALNPRREIWRIKIQRMSEAI